MTEALASQLRIEASLSRKPAGSSEMLDRPHRVAAHETIDHAGRMAAPIEHNLRGKHYARTSARKCRFRHRGWDFQIKTFALCRLDTRFGIGC